MFCYLQIFPAQIKLAWKYHWDIIEYNKATNKRVKGSHHVNLYCHASLSLLLILHGRVSEKVPVVSKVLLSQHITWDSIMEFIFTTSMSIQHLSLQWNLKLKVSCILCVQFGLHMFWEQLSIVEIQLNM